MTTILMASHQDPVDLWREALAKEMPELEFRAHPDAGDPAD
ncbi:MAG: glyoxylate/hydroxypyruvate reductase A, partial [Rhodospirillaceae bacterium]|nr:glyoxylate/hydroxypyruvate reductase A [Rhodospirillaceae bacterium]